MNRTKVKKVEREKTIQRATKLINQGVDILDPMKLDIRGSLKCGKNVKIDINVIIEGDVILDDNVIIDSNCIIKDSVIGSDSKIQANTIVESADIGESCLIGPYARIRPGSILKNHVQIGNFVEVKAAMIGTGCKINHLSYIGDAILEKNVIIGAGTITCNFDGTKNNDTYIEKGAFIGSSVQLVAPVRVGKNACIGAGSTITEDVPANELTIARSRQIVHKGKRNPVIIDKGLDK